MNNKLDNLNSPNDPIDFLGDTAPIPTGFPPVTDIPKFEEPNKEPPKIKKKGNGGLVIGIILAVILLVLGGGALYLFVFTSGYKVYTSIIMGAYNNAVSYINTNVKTANTVYTTGSFGINSNSEMLEFIDGYDITYEVALNSNNNEMYVDFGLVEDNNDLINVVITYLNNLGYLKSDELLNKVIKVEAGEIDFSSMLYAAEDYKVVLQVLYEGIVAGISENNISRKFVTKIADKTYLGFENKYLINEKELYSLAASLYFSLTNSDKALGLLAEYAGLEQSELKENVESQYEYYKDIAFSTKPSEEGIVITLYTNLIGTVDYAYINADNYELNVSFESKKSNIKIIFDGNTYATFTINNISTDKTSVAGEINAIEEAKIKFSTEVNSKTSAKEIEQDNNIKIELVTADASIDIGFTIKNKTIYDGEMPKLDVLNAIDVNELTEEDQLAISENLMNILTKMKLYNFISPYLDNYFNSQDDSYYDDDWANDSSYADDWY